MLLLDTLPMLGNVLMLCFFVFFIFGIVGVQLWAGRLRNRCYLVLPDNVSAQGSVDPIHPSIKNCKNHKKVILLSITLTFRRRDGG